MAGSCVAGSINNGGLAAGKDEFSVRGGVFGLVGGAAAVGLADGDAAQGEGMVQLAALRGGLLAGLGGGCGVAPGLSGAACCVRNTSRVRDCMEPCWESAVTPVSRWALPVSPQ